MIELPQAPARPLAVLAEGPYGPIRYDDTPLLEPGGNLALAEALEDRRDAVAMALSRARRRDAITEVLRVIWPSRAVHWTTWYRGAWRVDGQGFEVARYYPMLGIAIDLVGAPPTPWTPVDPAVAQRDAQRRDDAVTAAGVAYVPMFHGVQWDPVRFRSDVEQAINRVRAAVPAGS